MAEDLDPMYLSLGRSLKKVLKSRTSVLGGKKVEYFKGKDFILGLTKCKKLTYNKEDREFKTLKQISDFGDELIDKKIIKKVDPEYRKGDSRNPILLKPSRSYKFDKDGCYIWNPKVQQVKWQGLFLVFLVLGIIAACCFPIWPMSAKLGVWYVSVFLLCIILGTTVIRYIVFILFFIFGYDFWIIPNMYDDKAGFWETFSPLWFFRKRDDSKFAISIRVIVFFIVLSISVYTYTHPEVIEAIQELSVGGVKEIITWGEDKIMSNSTQISGPNFAKYDDVLKDEAPEEMDFTMDDDE
ncbi:hypothetical protein SteCoe_13205 [Stentor coeruleus]|uniref:Translocation protein SEC62 n=1 Tax=Stentor coeruleus TaxID=5963 RepID=A0A1R2C8W0_9CILI|nr:hypothetical protein SteCoe_13205 [Stentor coeruleus]